MTLQDYMKPEYFDRLITSVKTLCSSEESGKTKEVCTPSLALKLGFSLKKCITILIGKTLREKDNALLQDQKYLEKLMVSEWIECISHHSLSTLHQRKFNQIELLPLTKDLEIVHNYLLNQITTLSETLREVPTLYRSGNSNGRSHTDMIDHLQETPWRGSVKAGNLKLQAQTKILIGRRVHLGLLRTVSSLLRKSSVKGNGSVQFSHSK